MSSGSVRLLAFYLPQFHPIPENDRWWGAGFTDWVNVAKGRPVFPGHYQPHVPADLGYYDLREPATREAQAELARAHGISAFCYYHYWFGGKRLLHEPFDEVLRLGKPDFPFLLCWANENWTRRWDGRDQEVLMAQQHSAEDDRTHIEHLLPAFTDPRYLKVAGRPVFLVSRTELLPDPARTATIWRERARAAGLPGLYLMRVESFIRGVDPATIGFDAAVEFAPDWSVFAYFRPWSPGRTLRERWQDLLATFRLGPGNQTAHRVFRYEDLMKLMLAKPPAPYQRFRCVTPSWDNRARRPRRATVFHGASPERYELWLRTMIEQTVRDQAPEERLVFVNAWNEWGEGNHLEPDMRFGLAYLEATRRVQASTSGDAG